MFIPNSCNNSWVKSITLTGNTITLVPLSLEHCDDLINSVKDGELWKIWYLYIPDPEHMLETLKLYLYWQDNDDLIIFTVIDNKTGRAIGVTGYFKMFESSKKLDIGWTWYRKSAQKTQVNTEAKLLLLTHAFENLQCSVVGFGANWFNFNSHRAILRLGAKLDGTLRKHVLMPNGQICDYCMYSIIDNEWPAVKSNLLMKLNFSSK